MSTTSCQKQPTVKSPGVLKTLAAALQGGFTGFAPCSRRVCVYSDLVTCAADSRGRTWVSSGPASCVVITRTSLEFLSHTYRITDFQVTRPISKNQGKALARASFLSWCVRRGDGPSAAEDSLAGLPCLVSLVIAS